MGRRPVRRARRRRARLARPCRPDPRGGAALRRARLAHGAGGEVALAAGEPAACAGGARRSIALAGLLGREDIQVVGRSLEGFALVHEGRVEEGMRRLDEAAVAAKAGDVTDLMWVGKVCCNLIAACERVGDAERATGCEEVQEYAQRWELRTLFNTCRMQYASVLLRTGAWSQAEAELEAALGGSPARPAPHSSTELRASASCGAVRGDSTRRGSSSRNRSAAGPHASASRSSRSTRATRRLRTRSPGGWSAQAGAGTSTASAPCRCASAAQRLPAAPRRPQPRRKSWTLWPTRSAPPARGRRPPTRRASRRARTATWRLPVGGSRMRSSSSDSVRRRTSERGHGCRSPVRLELETAVTTEDPRLRPPRSSR